MVDRCVKEFFERKLHYSDGIRFFLRSFFLMEFL